MIDNGAYCFVFYTLDLIVNPIVDDIGVFKSQMIEENLIAGYYFLILNHHKSNFVKKSYE